MSLAARLRAADLDERLAAIAALVGRGRADAEEVGALAECLGAERKVVQRRAAEAFAALGAAGAPVRAVLLAALTAPASRRRWGAAYALSLGDAPPVQILPVLLESLGEDDGDLRWAAADIVVRLAEQPGLVDALCDLARAGNPPQRKMAVYCLRDLGARSPAVEAVVVAALDDADHGVRLAATTSLPHLALDRPAAAARLVSLVAAGDPRGRRSAAAALGTLGVSSDAVRAGLDAAAASDDPGLRRAAERARRQIDRGSE